MIEFSGGSIRRFQTEDAAAFLDLAGDEVVAKSAGLPHLTNLVEAREAVELRKNQPGEFVLVVGGQVVGQIGVYETDPDQPGMREIGYALRRNYWGRGLMTLALVAMFEVLKEQGVHILQAETLATNQRSGALLKRLGFKQIATYERPVLPGVDLLAGEMRVYQREM